MGFNFSWVEYVFVFYKGNQLVIIFDCVNSIGDDIYNWIGNVFFDFFLVDLEFNIVFDFIGLFNIEDNEGMAIFNSDYIEVYFICCFGGGKWDVDYCKIMCLEVSGNSWSILQFLLFMEEGINYGGLVFFEDGQCFYFFVDYFDGWGGYDFYYSEW